MRSDAELLDALIDAPRHRWRVEVTRGEFERIKVLLKPERPLCPVAQARFGGIDVVLKPEPTRWERLVKRFTR